MQEIRGKVHIIKNDKKLYAYKNVDKDLTVLFNYLKSRSFNNFPKVVSLKNNILVTRYINEIYDNNKEENLSKTIALLHYKTAYYKQVSNNKYKKIYKRLHDNIIYIKTYYETLINTIESEIYPSPSHYLIMRNYSIISSSIAFCIQELDKWYNLVENNNKQRVCTIHNNLSLDHFIMGKRSYLVSWDRSMVDTPIIDLYKLYESNVNLNFESIYNTYNEIFKLTIDEVKLFIILISIPKKIDEIEDEYINTINIKHILDYIYSTNTFVSKINNTIEVKEEVQ